MTMNMFLGVLLMSVMSCAQQAQTSSTNSASANKSYAGLQSTERYAKDQADLAQQEKMQICLDAKSALAKAQAEKDDKSAQVMMAKVKSFCD